METLAHEVWAILTLVKECELTPEEVEEKPKLIEVIECQNIEPTSPPTSVGAFLLNRKNHFSHLTKNIAHKNCYAIFRIDK